MVFKTVSAIAVLLGSILSQGWAQASPYQVLSTNKVGGDGGYDYVYADVDGRNLYVPRTGAQGRIAVYNLDTLSPVGIIPGINDGILYDAFDNSVYIFSHKVPHLTKIDAESGAVTGTLNLGGAPEQAVSDGNGNLYVDLEDKDVIARIDGGTLKVTGQFGLEGRGGTCAGLAMDPANHILFAACRNPQTMVILSAANGKVLDSLAIGSGCDGASFDQQTGEVFSSQRDGTLSVIHEDSPTSFRLEQTVTTMRGAKTHALDTKTNRVFLIAALPGLLPMTTASETFTVLEVGRP